MIIRRSIIILALFSFMRGQAQEEGVIFLSEGKIEFEKKVNVYALMGKDDNSWNELQKKTMSQFKTTYFDLLFTPHKTLYRPGREVVDNSSLFMSSPAEKNIVYDDLDRSESISQKDIFDQLFLVQDTMRKIRWKITDETREIAGFTCRRANALILDSIYVVAFYTDEILTSGGPESFHGLPGMILGVALPHQHVTWFATKVQAVRVQEAQVSPPQKGKKTDNAGLKQSLQKSLGSWGQWGERYIQASLL